MTPRRAVSPRSVAVGGAFVALICSLAAYNDFAMNNTNLVGNYLPVGLLLCVLFVAVLINGPLSRWRPTAALTAGELSVAVGMGLVGCGVASAGLMKYLPVLLVSPWQQAGGTASFAKLLDDLHLPTWMFPRLAAADAARRSSDPVVTEMFGLAPAASDTFLGHLRAVPWSAWVTPALTWGVLVAAMFGATLCGVVILRRQWVENERLPFPLAGVYLSLIEPPPAGRFANRLLGNRWFIVSATAVFAAHGVNALATYDPRHWPRLPLGYDLAGVLSNPPWVYLETPLKAAKLQFTFVGLSYFVQSRVSFSLWFGYLAVNLVEMAAAQGGTPVSAGMKTDQMFGATLPIFLAIVWVARRHLSAVARQMVGRRAQYAPTDPYAAYRTVGWGLVGCLAVVVGWLVLVGASVVGAAVIVAGMVVTFVVLARVVAETGLAFAMLPTPLGRPWVYLLADVPAAISVRTTTRSYFFANLFQAMFVHDDRESMPVFAAHAVRLADGVDPARDREHKPGRRLLPALIGAGLLAYVIAGAAYLSVDYTYSVSLDRNHRGPINAHAWIYTTTEKVLNPTVAYAPPNVGPREGHARLAHFAFGAGLSAVLAALRLRYAWWPLHPVGYLLAGTFAVQQVWFGFFVGWAAKVLLLRFGGARLYRAARPVFVGLIVGETAAGGFWLVVAIVLHATGHEFHNIRVLPD